MGLKGWVKNPLFGHGVEAFRDSYGITSHSTPTDLLYNSGLIGFALFYGMFISLAWRLYCTRGERPPAFRALILGTLIAFAFITLSGTMHYNAFLAAFIGISTALLSKDRGQTGRAVASAADLSS